VRIRALALCGAAGLLFAGQALADDRTIHDAVVTPVDTADPTGNGTPGNITIDTSGRVSIDTAGAAVTINSDNTVTNNGSIINQAGTDGVGVHVLGGFTGSLLDANGRPIGLTGTGSINIFAPTGETAGTGNIGVLIDGPGSFTGDIDLHGMSVSVTGAGAVGVQVDTGLTGNLLLGNTTIVGEGASALRTTAAVDGMISIGGSITAQGSSPIDTTIVDPVSGPALAIGGDVTGGILNVGPTSDSDTTTIAATIQTVGTGAAIEISPRFAGAGATDLTIGILDDTTNPGFSFVNRGSLLANGADPGNNSVVIRIEGDGTHTATLTGGIYNRGAIRAEATSNNGGATLVDPANANATAILIGAGGIVPTIVNDTGGAIAASTQGGPKGGAAVGVLIRKQGSLTSLVNNGTISAVAATTDTTTASLSAIAIQDLSGTLTSVTNGGIITVSATVLDNGLQIQKAADFSHNTTTFAFTNSGTVTGDIVFGSGSNHFTIDGDGAIATGSYHATGAGTLDIDVVNGTLSTPGTQAHNLRVGGSGVVGLTLPDTSSTSSLITLTGDGTFTVGSRISLAYSDFLGNGASFVIMHADGTLSFADLVGTTNQTKPFLYNTRFANDGHDLTLEVSRKSAAQLGFAGNLASVYEPAVAAAADDIPLGVALMSLTDRESAVTAFQSLMPTVNGAQRNYAIALTDQSFGPVGARQRALIGTPNQGHNLAFWGQEFWLSNQNDGSASVPGYADSGFGVAAGADYGSLSTGRYGVAFEHFNGDSVEGSPRITKTVNDWTVFSLYGDWSDADTGLFVGTQGSFGFGSFNEKRRIEIGPYTPTAQGHWTGWLTAVGVSVGDVIGDDMFAIIPQADIDALYMHESAYNERGAGSANLAVSERNSPSVRGFLGLVGRAQFEFAGGYVRPELHVGWTSEFAGHPADANVYFISAQDMHFKISGPAEPVPKFIGGGSLSFVYNNWSVGGDYDRTFASNASSEAGSVTVTGHF
jgi:uncharacterized protein YhjY with autotransporter beta-barrel domain